MKVHRDLTLTGSRAALDRVVANMERLATGGWSRDQVSEQEFADSQYCFKCAETSKHRAAYVWLAPRGDAEGSPVAPRVPPFVAPPCPDRPTRPASRSPLRAASAPARPADCWPRNRLARLCPAALKAPVGPRSLTGPLVGLGTPGQSPVTPLAHGRTHRAALSRCCRLAHRPRRRPRGRLGAAPRRRMRDVGEASSDTTANRGG
jgi:hypothetical protein